MRPLEPFIAIGLLGLCMACATPPDGPRFRPMTPPAAHETLLYIYRVETLRGTGAADVRLDGEKLGALQNGEYLALMLDPGTHELAIRLKWLGLIPRSWNRVSFVSRAGETHYVKVWAAYDEARPVAGEPQVAGRADRQAGVAIFLSQRTPEDAQAEIAGTRRSRRN